MEELLTHGVTVSTLDALCAAARANPRRRQNCNLHAHYEDSVQRLLNAVCLDSYIRPHRHLRQGTETLVAVRGRFGLILFDDFGQVSEQMTFGCESSVTKQDAVLCAIEMEVWHTVVALQDDAVLLEIKAGPFDPAAAKEAASWAPPEGGDDASAYLESLKARF